MHLNGGILELFLSMKQIEIRELWRMAVYLDDYRYDFLFNSNLELWTNEVRDKKTFHFLIWLRVRCGSWNNLTPFIRCKVSLLNQFIAVSTHQVEKKVTPAIQDYVSGVDVIRTVPVEQHIISVVQRAAAHVFSSKLNVCVPDESSSFPGWKKNVIQFAFAANFVKLTGVHD